MQTERQNYKFRFIELSLEIENGELRIENYFVVVQFSV